MRALTVHNIMTTNFNTLDFTGDWLAAVGKPELTGTWFIYGPPKNGKTSFAMMLAKYLSGFGNVLYNSIEEGLSLTIKMAIERTGLIDSKGVLFLDKEDVNDLPKRLKKQRSADIIIIDSVQFAEMNFQQYKKLKHSFNDKLFVYISHVKGMNPDGNTARRIQRDANCVFRVEGHRAFPVSRYGGGEPIDVCPERAEKYWGNI
ncbi:MAG: ATP-binding protein [Bacteroidetes bacterium]|nr:ATP-binding protein [Bacteroidota bacterium]